MFTGRMHLGLMVVTRGVGVGGVLGIAVSAASFTSEGRSFSPVCVCAECECECVYACIRVGYLCERHFLHPRGQVCLSRVCVCVCV